jgi:hypothetical protein
VKNQEESRSATTKLAKRSERGLQNVFVTFEAMETSVIVLNGSNPPSQVSGN